METEVVTFCHDDLRRISFLAFEDMRKNRELCDITINIQSRMIVAHRVVLAAGIPYFRSMFLKNTDRGNEISIPDVDPNALESLIDFAYSSEVKISVENARSLLVASEFLQLRDVMDACVKFLSERLHAHSVVEVCMLAHNLNNQKLIENCSVYAQQNFEEFSKSKDFLDFPYPYVKDLISSDDLNVCNEETVFDAMMNWVKFSPEERQSMLPDLLRKVRLTNLPVKYLIKRVATEKLIKASADCKDLIQSVLSFHLLPKEDRTFFNLNTVPRRGIEKQIYVICESNQLGHSLYRCDFSKNSWKELNSDGSLACVVLRVACANNKVYLFCNDKIRTFCLRSLKWEILESTHENIEGSALLSYRHLIYFFGAFHSSVSDKVRCFDTRQNKWLNEARMVTGRANTAVTSVKESIYVTGGFRKSKTFQTFEKCNLSIKQWSELSPMLVSRSLHGCASINEQIYVFGGCCITDSSCLSYSSSSEVYDLLTNLWSSIAPMKTARNSFSFVTHCRKIYVFGGRTKSASSSQDVEFYDPECDQWKSSFSVPEGFVGTVVM